MTSLVELAKGLLVCKGTNLKGGLKNPLSGAGSPSRHGLSCAFYPRNLAQERCSAVAQLAQNAPIRLKKKSVTGLRIGSERWVKHPHLKKWAC